MLWGSSNSNLIIYICDNYDVGALFQDVMVNGTA
jgi:hypothetical protein